MLHIYFIITTFVHRYQVLSQNKFSGYVKRSQFGTDHEA
nr:MAG TPA: hypothetical protein [Caudoviricetes sp.]